MAEEILGVPFEELQKYANLVVEKLDGKMNKDWQPQNEREETIQLMTIAQTLSMIMHGNKNDISEALGVEGVVKPERGIKSRLVRIVPRLRR